MTARHKRRTYSAPRKIARVAAQRVFQRPDQPKRPVILTIGVPQAVAGSDWGCAVQITGLTRSLSRPRFVFGIDAIQALVLALQYAKIVLDASKDEITWIDETGDLGLPLYLPMLPKRHQDRVQRMMDREVERFYKAAKRKAQKREAPRRMRPKSGGD
jgi:hypothetical protein